MNTMALKYHVIHLIKRISLKRKISAGFGIAQRHWRAAARRGSVPMASPIFDILPKVSAQSLPLRNGWAHSHHESRGAGSLNVFVDIVREGSLLIYRGKVVTGSTGHKGHK